MINDYVIKLEFVDISILFTFTFILYGSNVGKVIYFFTYILFIIVLCGYLNTVSVLFSDNVLQFLILFY